MVDLSPQLRYLEFLEVLERANDQVFGFWLLEEVPTCIPEKLPAE